jgi:hypothetical protein
MSNFARLESSLTAYSNTYDADGSGYASLPVNVNVSLGDNPGDNPTQIITIRATEETAGLIVANVLEFTDAAANNGIAAALSVVRPLGGSGYANLQAVLGLSLVVTGDEKTSDEESSGNVVSRLCIGTCTGYGAVGEIAFRLPFYVSQPGERQIWEGLQGNPQEPAVNIARIELKFSAFHLGAKIELLTASLHI